MCTDFRNTDETCVTGWKAVMLIDGQDGYYSIMTGERYPEPDELMPVWTTQARARFDYFDAELLKDRASHPCWHEEMSGRTSVFRAIGSCQATILRDIHADPLGVVPANVAVRAVRCEISCDLLAASYDGEAVVCCRKIKFLEDDS